MTTRTFSGTPDDAQVGTLALKVMATDEAGSSADAAFNLTNYAVNYSGGVGIAFLNYNSALNFTNLPTLRLGALGGTPSSLSGTIREVLPDGLDIVGVGGREWRIVPAPGALIRLNGKAAPLDTLQAGDGVVILGQAQPGPGGRFLAHAITARRK